MALVPVSPRFVLAVLVAAVAATAAGWGLGHVIGQQRAAATRRANERVYQEHQRRLLLAEINGIAVGAPFPDIPLWPLDGGQCFSAHELLPRGGVVLLVSPVCSDCLDAIYGMDEAIRAAGGSGADALVISDRRLLADSLQVAMSRHGISLRLYCDQQENLRREFNVKTPTADFVIDSAGVVTNLGAGRRDKEAFVELFSQ